MGKITYQQYREALNFEPAEAMGTIWRESVINQYHEELNKSIRKGTIVSGLVALALIGGVLISDALTPKEVKYRQQINAEQMAKEMPYGIR